MLSVWLKTASLFNKSEKLKILMLLLYSVLISIVELAGIASIMPFIATLTSPELVEVHPLLSKAYKFFSFDSYRNFAISLGFLSFSILIISHILELTYSRTSVRFINMKEYELSTALLRSYLTQSFEKVSGRNTSELSKNILQDVENVISGILFSGMSIVSSSISAIFIIGLMLFMDPLITISVTLLFGICYGAIFLYLSPKIRKLGGEVKELYEQMYINTQQALDALKEIKASDKEIYFVQKYASPRKASAINYIQFKTTELIPKQLLEVTAFGSVIIISIYFIYEAENPGISYSIIAMFAFAAYRIIPMVKAVFEGMESFNYYRTFVDTIWDDLSQPLESSRSQVHIPKQLTRIEEIELQQIGFRYSTRAELALDNINVTIRTGERVCLIGPSGAGKTTTVDVLLGLLAPETGCVLINGSVVQPDKFGSVRSRIGYVPQDPYLLDDSLKANILFGEDDLDLDRATWAYRAAGLTEVFGPSIETAMSVTIGQHGGRLSGGQRQRIAIARALYKKPDVLILDESTNGLDLATEQQLLNKLATLDQISILFVSHRPSVMKACERLIVLDKGKVVAMGSLDEVSRNESYRSLVM